jgi:ubiquinone/menaquinone biosynthesis C-methylase UbiE
MQSSSSLLDPSQFISDLLNTDLPFLDGTVGKQAYRGFQWSKNVFGIAHKTLTSRVLNTLWPVSQPKGKPLPPGLMQWIEQRFEQLIETDWEDAEKGVYPASLVFDNPWDDFFKFYPAMCLDAAAIWHRANRKQFQEFSPETQTEGYPSYYLQNFHHQTNGYLSDDSANLYDLQVEILFGGTADAMRRRVLAPLKQHLTGLSTPKILDIACGTGRTLRFLQATFPQAALYGTDLSPAYLRKATQLLAQSPAAHSPQLTAANAESLPYGDGDFDALTSVFLFHELPAAVRQQVINEAHRVLKPGGLFVVCDSIQALDLPEAEPMMANFASMFHEPYYRHYTTDDLNARLTDAGFTQVETFTCFMSKYWVARKS